MDDLKEAKIQPNTRIRRTYRKANVQGNHFYCYDCNQWIRSSEFYVQNRTTCKACCKYNTLQRAHTLNGFMARLLSNARRSSKYRRSMHEDTRNECSIALNYLFDVLEQQEFKCYYSGIPMTFQPKMDWKCSIERLDNMQGYIKGNVVLICWEFNSSDRTVSAVNPVRGSSQWSKEKFEYFYQTRFGENVCCNS
eukprot:362543_1